LGERLVTKLSGYVEDETDFALLLIDVLKAYKGRTVQVTIEEVPPKNG
jgi:hypothetical protein